MTTLPPLSIGVQPGTNAEYWLDAPARARHLFVLGQTGTGKTTLLERLIAQDLAAGAGLALLDPHGDLATAVIEHLPHYRANDLIFLDPADRTRPIGFNILDDVPADAIPTVVDSIITAFVHIWGEVAIGSQTQMLLRNSLHALIEAGNQSLLALPRLISEDAFRTRILHRVRDPLVLRYWRVTFAGYDGDFRGRMIAPLQNKLDALLSSDLRNIIGQPKSTIHIPRIMGEGRVFIARLSKGQIGEGPAHLLGALLTTAFANAAFARAAVPEHHREPFTLYADEFPSFASGGFPLILSEARKYRLSLVIGAQYLQQLEKSEGLKEAVFGNVGSVIAFRVGADDAPYLARHLEVGKIESGTFVGDKLAYYVWKTTGTGMVIDGAMFYLSNIEKTVVSSVDNCISTSILVVLYIASILSVTSFRAFSSLALAASWRDLTAAPDLIFTPASANCDPIACGLTSGPTVRIAGGWRAPPSATW